LIELFNAVFVKDQDFETLRASQKTDERTKNLMVSSFVRMISTPETIALRNIGLSIMSRIDLSSSTGISGVSTISIESRELEMNDSRAGRLSGTYFV